VVAVTLGLVDLFNTPAVPMGLAARYFAIMGSAGARDELAAAPGLTKDDDQGVML
jgi:hypothetical protein